MSSYPWERQRPTPGYVPPPEERVRVMQELRAFRATLRRGTPRPPVERAPEPISDCAECWQVGIARCGEHGLASVRRRAPVADTPDAPEPQ